MPTNPANPSEAVRQHLREKVILDVATCKRCGAPHEKVEFVRFNLGDQEHTHWAYCPVTGEPLMLNMRSTQRTDDPKAPQKFSVDLVKAGPKASVREDARWPEGRDIIPPAAQEKIHCVCQLPYPAEGPGLWRVRCLDCQATVSCAAGGVKSDPKSIAVPCRR